MHNTSGIRDMLEVMRLGGVDLGQPCARRTCWTPSAASACLNFPPNTRYLYSNSNFMLLGRVVEQVQREPLREFWNAASSARSA